MSAKKPKHTSVVNVVNALPTKTPKNISAKCGKSKSASKIRLRRTSHPTKNRVRTVTTYCNGGTRTVFYIKRTLPAVKTPVPTPVTPAAPAPKNFRLTLLHNNDGESKYVVGDSIANYGGITRFKTVLDGLRADAANADAGGANKGTVFISSGDNFLAGLNLRASFQRFDAGLGPFYDSQAIDALGYDAVTIGNHEYDFGPGRLAEFVALSHSQFITANTDYSDEPILQTLRNNGRIADSVVVDKGGEKIGIIGVSPPETPTISSSRNVKFSDDVINIVNTEAARLTAAGVNKIILSSHLQNTENEKTVVAGLQNVDIVISGGADDLLANSGDRLVPGAGSTGRPVPDDRQGQVRRRRADRHHPGRVPLRRPPDGDVRPGGPPDRHRRREVRPGARDRRPHAARLRDRERGPQADHHRPAGRLQGEPGGEHDRHHGRAARRRQPEPDPPQGVQPR